MAAVPAAARLTEAHRLAQSRLGAQTIQQMRAIWPILDVEDLDGSFDRWLDAAVRVIRAQRSVSSTLGANYLRAFKVLELGRASATVPTVLDAGAVIDQLATSLLVTGPVKVKQALSRGLSPAAAMSDGEASSAAAAMRHTLDGGRNTIIDSTDADREALGWARATSGSPCHFCAMLASRGPVYTKDSGNFEAHDHCSCSTEPVYRDDAAWPPGSERYADLWREAKQLDGDTTSNFRRLIEAE